MEFLRHLLLFFHLLGMASLVGGFLVQLGAANRRVNPAILHGALTQLVTGVLLVGLLESTDLATVDRAKIGVKLLVALVIVVLAWVTRKPPSLGKGLFFGMFVLSLLNVAVAVFWT
ncbi:MAG TPA: hypothetical protein VI076_07150 [Actinopolymorphaceae bacterium]